MRPHVFLASVLVALLLSGPLLAQHFEASEAEVQAFVAADQDRDGMLTRAEFRIFVQAMARAGQPTARQIRFFGAYRYAFDIADADGNGIVTPLEMRRGDDAHQAGQ